MALETQTLARLERKIDKALERLYRPVWVKASVITGLTGWNFKKMQQARENGYIEWEEREKDGVTQFWYNLHSLDSKFIQQRA